LAAQPVIELQSLRGLAATIVLVHHCLRSVYSTPISAFVADRVLDAQAAVVFFFVLSGYVLSASLSKKPHNASEILGFYVRRIFRIYPAILVACLAVIIVLIAVPPPSGKFASVWMQSYHTGGMEPFWLIALSFMSVSMYLHPMLWTMFIELNASAFMPVIATVQRHGTRTLLVLILGLSLLSFTVQDHTKQVSVYLVTFAIGAAVPYLSSTVVRLCSRSRFAESASLVAAVAVLFWFRELVPRDLYGAFDPLIVQVEALASMWIVALTVYRPHGYARLRHPVLVKLGDISYGIYLLHFPILLVAVAAAEHALPPSVNMTALGSGIAVTVYVATVTAAAACYMAVEMPAVVIGARVARSIRRRFAAPLVA
jgi:peptidoglycan/LPS O-acetylase OafA/YrhL